MPSIVAATVISIHVLAGTFWLGTLAFTWAFLAPSLGVAGPAGGQIMKHMVQVRHLPVFMTSAVVLSFFTGVAMFWQFSGGLTWEWMTSRPGCVLTLGAVAAFAMAVLGATVNAPTAEKIGKLGALIQAAGKPPTPEQTVELQRLQRRLAHATRVAAITLSLAAVAMVSWRYV